MGNDIKIFIKVKEVILRLVKIAKEKLDKLSLLNLLLIIFCFLFAVVFAISESIISLFYTIADILGQLFAKKIINPSIDTTPFWQYGFFLLLGLIICISIVRFNNKKELW